MKRATVKALVLDRVSNAPVVLLGIENTNKVLPIWIGACEASVMALALEKIPFERPLTHDLILSILEELNVRLDKFVIHSIVDNVFYAKMVLRDLGVNERDASSGVSPFIEVDARPSDCIILSLKTGVPIYVTNDIVASEAITLEDAKEPEENFKKFVENLDINEFRKILDDPRMQQGE